LKRLLDVRFVNHSPYMSSSRKVGCRKVNSDGDDLAVNNKAVADPPAVTEGPLTVVLFENNGQTICLTKRKKSATAVIGEDNMQFFVMISYPTENGNLTDE
ncbi:hypothetical protein T08_13528, partial [Trichinella sp. T8]